VSVIQKAIEEIEVAHQSCSNTNWNRCAKKHRQLIADLLEYESVIEQNVKAEIAGGLEELRNDWIMEQNIVNENPVFWLKQGFDVSIQFIEKGLK
jgi:hypothetical protein